MSIKSSEKMIVIKTSTIRNCAWGFLAVLWILFTSSCSPTGTSLPPAEDFKTPPMEYRPVPLWFWNNTEVQKDEIEHQIRNMIEKDGYGGFAILPFGEDFQPEFLTESYFEVYGEALKIASELGLQVSLYDEYGYPSGSAGAIHGDNNPRFKNKYPGSTIKRLDKLEIELKGPSALYEKISFEGKLMGIVAMEISTLERIDITINYSDGKLGWDVPPGTWKVMVFTCVKDGDPNVDYLDPEAVRKFIGMVHQSYYDRFSEYFSSTIKSTFHDEPTMYRANARMWTNRFNEKFIEKHGFDPVILYPSLWYDIGDQTAAARNYLFGFRSELYAEGFHKTIQDWCDQHNIAATGHQDNEEIINPVGTSGDLMKCFKYMDIPGIDKIGGNRPAERFYKVVSSAAINWDKSFVMSETYGAMGNPDWDEMYHIAMEQYTKGINMLIPHAVWYNTQNVYSPPELSWRNPLYSDRLPEFNRFLARLNIMLQIEGRHVADIAMLYPIHTFQAEHYFDGPLGWYQGGVEVPEADYPEISEILTNKLGHDFVYLHPEVIDEKCTIVDNTIRLNNKIQYGTYQVLILPSVQTISLSNMEMIHEFYKSGGKVIFTTQLPVQATVFNQDEDVRSLIKEIFNVSDFNNKTSVISENRNGGKAVFIPEPDEKSIGLALKESQVAFDVMFEPGKHLNYIHKKIDNRDLYYFANLHDMDINTNIKLRGEIKPEIWDPHTGDISSPDYSHKIYEGIYYTNIKVSIPGNQSFFVVSR